MSEVSITDFHRHNYEPVCFFVCNTYERVKDQHNLPIEFLGAMKHFASLSRELFDCLHWPSGQIKKLDSLTIEIEDAANEALRIASVSPKVGEDLRQELMTARDMVRVLKLSLAS